jgi:hypothetical protein
LSDDPGRAKLLLSQTSRDVQYCASRLLHFQTAVGQSPTWIEARRRDYFWRQPPMSRISFGARWYYVLHDELFLPCLCGGPILIVGALGVLLFLREQAKFDAQCVPTKGVVTQAEGHFRVGGKSYDEVSYRFTAKDGASYTGSQKVGNRGSQYPVGRTVDIDYLPADPTSNRMRDPDAAGPIFLWIIFWFCLPLGVLLSVGIIVGWVLISRRIRLLLRGTPVVGRVIERLPAAKSPRSNDAIRVRYAFTDLTGREREERSPPIPKRRQGQWEEGASVLVVCDPNNPKRYEPDIFGVREPEIAPDR